MDILDSPFIGFAAAWCAFCALTGILTYWRFKKKFWFRPCTGIRWRRRFPDASKEEIRAFLDVFVEAFGFFRKRRLQLRPDDQVVDIYNMKYPAYDFGVDCLELETLAIDLEKKYEVDVTPALMSDEPVTLGQLFALTHLKERKAAARP
ncbi:hypothetical protein HQ520_09730 [bacterium]|nr:hypothetical protein [bacterium]